MEETEGTADKYEEQEKKVKTRKALGGEWPLIAHLVLLQLAPPTLKEALLCGRLRSKKPSSSRRLRLDMVPVRSCSFSESDPAEE